MAAAVQVRPLPNTLCHSAEGSTAVHVLSVASLMMAMCSNATVRDFAAKCIGFLGFLVTLVAPLLLSHLF